MNVIVTNNNIDYGGFVKVKSLSEAVKITGNIDFLVYHKSNEEDLSRVSSLTSLKDRVGHFIYIRSKENCEVFIQIIVLGLGGTYLDDEFFLTGSTELTTLVNNYTTVNALVNIKGADVVSDFMERLDGGIPESKEYLKVVQSALTDMVDDYTSRNSEFISLAKTATNYFASSMEIIGKLKKEHEKLQTKMAELTSSLSTVTSNTPMNRGIPSLVYFPRVPYKKESKILRIKEIGTVSYLVSFVLGFKAYLEQMKFLRPKVIFIYPVGKQYEELYSDYTWVTQGNYTDTSLYGSDIVFTNYPSKDVLNNLLNCVEYDTFIVIDRLKSDFSHILDHKGCLLYAVTGEEARKKADVKYTSCISLGVRGMLLGIKARDDYPEDVSLRDRFYLQNYSKEFANLYVLMVSI